MNSYLSRVRTLIEAVISLFVEDRFGAVSDAAVWKLRAIYAAARVT